MNDIEKRIDYEKEKIESLNNKKEELLYGIPNRLNEKLKRNVLGAILITTIFTACSTVFGGWFLMDYGKLLLPSLSLSTTVSGIGALVNYFSKTGIERRKLKRGNIPKINQDILKCENSIKALKQELIRIQSRVINEQMNNQPHYTRVIPQQVSYYQEESYEKGRSR